tara:strand:- start:60 stop:1751 length:1692 start_codon:yes stop_codon:yes gene_type:complete
MGLTKTHNRMIAGASFNVKDYGAVGDGVADDTTAIRAADTAAAAVDGVVFFPIGDYSFSSTLEPSFGVTWIGENARQSATHGVRLIATSAVSRGIAIIEKDSIRLINIFLDMINMTARQTYTASTISFDAATSTINDSANGLGVFERGELIQFTSGTTNQPYIIKDVSAGTITVHFLGVTATAGSSVTITAGACGVWGNGYRRCIFDNFNIQLGSAGKGWVGFNGHDGLRSTYYNRHVSCSIKPDSGINDGVLWALSSTQESALTAFTSNYFEVCIAQGSDYGWYFGGSGAGVIMMNCHGESANTLGLWVADTASANNTAVKCYGGEWSDVDAGKVGALHMIGSVVNGTVGSKVLNEYYGRFLNQPVQLNRVQVDDDEITTTATNLDLQINPNGTGGLLVKTDGTSISRTNAIHGGGLEVYRETATTTADVFEVYSDVGGSKTQKFIVEADGDTLNATGSYGTISDNRLKQNITAASSQWSDIAAIDVVNYQLTALGDDAPTFLGVTAQQLEAEGINGLVKTDEETGYKSVKYSILYMKAVKALQEAMDRIEQLEARVTELEP